VKKMLNKAKIFVSYSLPDSGWVEVFARGLRERGFDVWLGTNAVGPGEMLQAATVRNLRESDVVVMLFDAMTLNSPSALFELGAAMAGNKAVVPVIPGDLDLAELPVPLRQVRFVRRDGPDTTAAQVAGRLLKAS